MGCVYTEMGIMKEGIQPGRTEKNSRVVTLTGQLTRLGGHILRTHALMFAQTHTYICTHTHIHLPMDHLSIFTRHIKYDIQFAAELTNKI